MADPSAAVSDKAPNGKKRKKNEIDGDGFESLEIDINAPEPASKKALRKAKRAKAVSHPKEQEFGPTDRKKASKGNETLTSREPTSRSPYGIWIGNLPFFVSKEDLQKFLVSDTDNAIAPDQITRINLPQGTSKPGSAFQNKGFAYVDFLSADVVEKALHLSEKLVGGRRVLIKNSKDFQGRPQLTAKAPEPNLPSTKRIFVGNLEFDVTKEDLEHHFEVCGPIHYVHVATFQDSGKCKGYAWVEFEQLSSAEGAMRGWVEISDPSVNAEKENNPMETGNFKKVKKRLWVNKMGGRKLRMEFAEDKATRYKKRYGKDSRSEGLGDTEESAAHQRASDEEQGRSEAHDDASKAKAGLKKLSKSKHPQHLRVGYSVASIQKLTGAITEGQGTKVTFD
ncbi:hypothetical protein EPUS_03125 [Endocarpon pusillum Z07020]|uniref:RRM domain-containing protein n=1 Tax=Endocarpon pusillum (strain Z07020 / HMAS-L-300199) TaxID=1263415 RepID=U1G7A8_ENDPU|nr:uncharacterized protein EPUS_03125 [Endocarpon pusillum Z07020]ERF73292.1 hypothetical protein EPUS_03125 [Endocarpon pusillum Z07020]